MADSPIASALKYANLQAAAEALLSEANPNLALGNSLRDGNRRTIVFPDALADHFVSDYEVIAHRSNTTTGFSGTLFRTKVTDAERGLIEGELTLSFRSTEFVDDAIRDSKSTNQLEVKELGWAVGQIADMESWYSELQAVGAVDSDRGIPPEARLVVTGYSLGGHLATAFNLLRAEKGESSRIAGTYTFNGAGVGGLAPGTKLDDIIADFVRWRDDPRSIPWEAFHPSIRVAIEQQARGRIADIDKEELRLAGTSIVFIRPLRELQVAQKSFDYQVAALLATLGRADPVSNFPGIGGENPIPTEPVFAAVRLADMTEVVGSDGGRLGPSFVANSGIHYGFRQEIYIEDQPLSRGGYNYLSAALGNLLQDGYPEKDFSDTHSMVLLVDSLSLMAKLERLTPNLRPDVASGILASMSSAFAEGLVLTQGRAEGDTLERALDALGKLIIGANWKTTLSEDQMRAALMGNTWHLSDLRTPYHERLQELGGAIESLAGLGGYSIDSLVTTEAGNLIELAGQPLGIAYRYALRELNPFAILGPAELYTQARSGGPSHNALGDLDLFVSALSTPAGMTAEYLADRAAMLSFLAKANTNNTNTIATNQFSNNVLYTDYVRRADGKGIEVLAHLPGGVANFRGPNTRVVGFGSNGSDGLQGRDNADRLYGGLGADFLRGGKADDYLEGGAGRDVYQYNASKIVLSASNDGDDIVRDTDGAGILRYVFKDGLLATPKSTAIAGVATKLTPTRWQSPNGKFTFDRQGSDLFVIVNGDAGGSIRIKDFDFDKAEQSGYLGVRLTESPGAPETFARAFLGDTRNYDGIPATPEVDPREDGFGNAVRADGQEGRVEIIEADRADFFYGANRDEAERFDLRGGNDVVLADGTDSIGSSSGGRDLVEAGAGRDIVEAGAADDWIEGGIDGDILGGNAGNDVVWGDTRVSGTNALAQAIDAGETAVATSGLGDLLTGDAGNDVLVGAATADLLLGGEGLDILVGGAGADTLYGDAAAISATLSWSIARTEIPGVPRLFEVSSTNFTLTANNAIGAADVIYGGIGADWIFAGAGDDYVEGGNSASDANFADDVLFGDAGSDILVGGSGRDFIHGDSASVDAANLSGNDYLDGGAGDDELLGGKGDDILFGGEGDDTLAGGEGDDFLFGGPGQDIMLGGPGKDTYVFERGDGLEVIQDVPEGTGDADKSVLALGDGITAQDVKFRLGSLMVDLGNGDEIHFNGFDPDDPLSTPLLNSIQFADGTQMTYQDILDQGFDLDGTEGNDVIEGTAVTDRIDAKGGNDDIAAGAGDDTIDGGVGFDIINAEEGNDTITTSGGGDVVFGGAGDDTVFTQDGDLIIDQEGVNHLDLTAYDGLSVDNLEITQYAGRDGETYLNFHVRDDEHIGFTPAEGGVSVQRGEMGDFATLTLSDGESGMVTLTHAELMDEYVAVGLVYHGRDGDETLFGTPFADKMFGRDGADTMHGGAGADQLDGGKGDDVLSGGAGNDTYLLANNGGRDTVIEDGDAEQNAVHTIRLADGISRALVRAVRVGDDLQVRLHATNEALILKDFYLQPTSWQEGWQVKDSAHNTVDLLDLVPVIPPSAATWIEEEANAFRARREQVFAANRQAEGYGALGGNSFQKYEVSGYSYPGRTSTSTTTTRSLIIDPQTGNGASISVATGFTSTNLSPTTSSFEQVRPVVRGAQGTRKTPSTSFGNANVASGDDGEFVPVGSGFPGLNVGRVQVNPGDIVVPVFSPRIGNLHSALRNASTPNYGNFGEFQDPTQWTLAGYRVYRAQSVEGMGFATSFGSVTSTNTNQVYDERLTVRDLTAGGSANTISAGDGSVIDAGAGNDTITLQTGFLFAGPNWQASFDLASQESYGSPSDSQERYFDVLSILSSGYPNYGNSPNTLGGFAFGGDGDDTTVGSEGQDVIAPGEGADSVDGRNGSDRYLVAAADSGIDTLSDSGIDTLAYLDWYYWSRGIPNWDERADHANQWRHNAIDGGNFKGYFNTPNVFGPNMEATFIAPLPEAAPALTRDDPLYHQLVAAGVLTQDVLEFGPGLELEELEITVAVDGFSAADYPERSWRNGGKVSIRWGSDGGVDFDAPRLDSHFGRPDLLSGGPLGDDDSPPINDGSWRGHRLGEGIEAFRFADGTTLTLDELLANATVTVVPAYDHYDFRRHSGYQLIERGNASVEFGDNIRSDELSFSRDGRDLLFSTGSDQARIRNWYADPQTMPGLAFHFALDSMDAETITWMGLNVVGTEIGETLTGLDGFANGLFAEGGNDLVMGGDQGDSFDGGSGNDTLYGGAGDDVVEDLSGDDALYGGDGDDYLYGGPGDDLLDGGEGSDTYFFFGGEGVDIVADSGVAGVDTLLLPVESGQVTLGLGSMLLRLGETGGRIHIQGFDPANATQAGAIERFEFGDGLVLTHAQLVERGFDLLGTAADDAITGTSVDDRIDGLDGDDVLVGGAGDDELRGGAGNDVLSGGTGDDIYHFDAGDGEDTIDDSDQVGRDVLRFGDGIGAGNVGLSRSDSDLVLSVSGAGSVTLEGWYLPGRAFDAIMFAGDGTVWDATVLKELAPPAADDPLNSAPRLANPIVDQAATEDAAFGFVLPPDTFADSDANDRLVYSAGRAGGAALPGWLSFDAEMHTFSGIPGNADVGTLEIRVTVTDDSNVSTWGQFQLSVANVNDAPLTADDSASAAEDAVLSATGNVLANDSDIDANTLLAVALPGSFQGTFGSLLLTHNGAYAYALDPVFAQRLRAGQTVTDTFGYAATDGVAQAGGTLTVSITGKNDAPFLHTPLADAAVTEGVAFSYQVPGGAFIDPDEGDILTLAARLANGDALPAWLTFDAGQGKLSGTAGAGQGGIYAVELTATDGSGASAAGSFLLDVAPGSSQGQRFIGTTGNDVLNGTSRDDLIDGRAGSDRLNGNGGNDVLQFHADARWPAGYVAQNAGSPGSRGTGEATRLSGRTRSHDVFDGGPGNDRLLGTDGPDAIVLDDRYSPPAGNNGPRLTGIEYVEAGRDDDVIDLTSARFAYGDVVLDGGDGDDVLWASAGDDLLLGGKGDDDLYGGAGDDLLAGGRGNDVMNGGVGNDFYLHEAKGGDDVVEDVDATDGNVDTLRFGSGIDPSMVKVRRRGQDLLLDLAGSHGSVTIKDWFRAKRSMVERIEFESGAVWGEAEIRDRLDDRRNGNDGGWTAQHPRGWRDENDDRHGTQPRGSDRFDERDDRFAATREAISSRLSQIVHFDFEALIRALGESAGGLGSSAPDAIARQWSSVQRYAAALVDAQDEERRHGAMLPVSRGLFGDVTPSSGGSSWGYEGSVGAARGQEGLRSLEGLRDGFRQL